MAPAPIGASALSDAQAVWQIAIGLSSSRESSVVLHRVVEAALALGAGEAAALVLYDPEQALFSPTVPSVAVGLDERWLQRQGLEAVQALAKHVADSRDMVIVLDTATAPELDLPLLRGQRRPGAVCMVPLTAEGSLVGVVAGLQAAARSMQYPVETLRVFGELAGLAVANAQTHEREQRLRMRLEALDQASRAIVAELSLHQVLQRIVEVAAAMVGARYGALGVVGADGYLTDFITTGISSEERERIGQLPRGHGLLGVLIRLSHPLRVPNIQRDPRRVGFPPHHPPMTSLLGVPIRVRNEVVGNLYLTDKLGGPAFLAEDEQLVELLAAHAGIAIENARLYAQMGELTLLRERERIARDLHDGIIQDIYATTLQLEVLAMDSPEEGLRERLVGVTDKLIAVIAEIRTYIQGLRARELAGRSLQEGIAALVDELDRHGGVQATLVAEGEPFPLPEERSHTLLQIAREALANVSKHAQASRAEVRLAYFTSEVKLTIADDGHGFAPEAVQGEGHHGLRNLRQRAVEAGGSLQVRSSPATGTTVTAVIPR